MQIRVNEGLIKRKADAARVGSLGGMLFIILAFVFYFLGYSRDPRWFPAAYVMILVGFIMGSIGNRQVNEWVTEPRKDQALSRNLRSLDNRHYLYLYCLPARHVLLAPYGLFVILAKGAEGRIRCRGDRWTRNFSLIRLIRGFAPEPLGNPSIEAKEEVKKLRLYIEERLPGVDLEIAPLIVFTHPEVSLEVASASLPVMPLKSLKSYLRKMAEKEEIPEGERKNLVRIFDEKAA